jgi:hypothetical protein
MNRREIAEVSRHWNAKMNGGVIAEVNCCEE